MSICPKCGKEMPTFAPKCPNCGYDFPFDEREFREQLAKKRRGSDFAESGLASAILGIASALMAIGALLSLMGMMWSIWNSQWMASLSSFLSAIFLAAFSITFTRILNLK